VRQLAEPFAISGPAISRHLKVLSRAGLVVQGRRAQWRPCRLDATPLKEVLTYAETYRQVWEGNLDNLEAYLKELKEPQQPAAAHRGRRKRR
jgi:DNA-binding transcriptional ArsR family regulator